MKHWAGAATFLVLIGCGGDDATPPVASYPSCRVASEAPACGTGADEFLPDLSRM